MHSDFWMVAGLVAAGLVLAWVAKGSEAHRRLRNRRKNYGRVTSKSRRPMVMLSVKTRGA